MTTTAVVIEGFFLCFVKIFDRVDYLREQLCVFISMRTSLAFSFVMKILPEDRNNDYPKE